MTYGPGHYRDLEMDGVVLFDDNAHPTTTGRGDLLAAADRMRRKMSSVADLHLRDIEAETKQMNEYRFTEPNTGRKLVMRIHAGDRVGIFDVAGNYVMDVDPELSGNMNVASERVKRMMTGNEPAHAKPISTARVFPGALYTAAGVDDLSDKEVHLACTYAGISPANGDMRNALVRHNVLALRLLDQSTRDTLKRLKRSAEDTDGLKASNARLVDDLGRQGKSLGKALEDARTLRESNLAADGVFRTLTAELSTLKKVHADQYSRQVNLAQRLDCAKTEISKLKTSSQSPDEYQRRIRELARENDELRIDRCAARDAAALAKSERLKIETELDGARTIAALGMPETFTQHWTDAAETHRDHNMEPTSELPVPRPPAALTSMLTDALQLAAIQQTAAIAVEKVSPLLVRAGANESFIMDPKIQKILALVIPYAIAQYGHMVPGLKRMDAVQSLSQQQMVIGMADIIGVSIRDLMGIGVEMISALNEGSEPVVEQLPGQE